MPSPGQELSSIDYASMIGGPLNAAINAQAQAAMTTVNFISAVGFKRDQNGGLGDPVYVGFRYPKEIQPYQPAMPATLQVALTSGGTGYTAAGTRATITGVDGAEATVDVDPNGTISRINVTKQGNVAAGASPTLTITGDGTGAAATISVLTGRPAVPAVYQTQLLEVPILTMLPIPNLKLDKVVIDFNAKITSSEYTKTSDSLDLKVDAQMSFKFLFFSVDLKVSAAMKRASESGTNVERQYSMQVHVEASQADMPSGLERILGVLEKATLSSPVPVPNP